MKQLLISILLLGMVGSAYAQEYKGIEIVQSAFNKAVNFSSLSWDVTVKRKFLDRNDTIVRTGHVDFVGQGDAGFLMHVVPNDSTVHERLVSLDTSLWISKMDSSVSMFLRENGEELYYNNQIPDAATDAYANVFMRARKPGCLSTFLTSTLHKYSLCDISAIEDIAETPDTWTVKLSRPDDTLTVVIRKADTMLVFGESIIQWEGQSQYYSHELSNFTFSPTVPTPQERLDELPAYFDVKLINPSGKEPQPLALGERVEWAGRYVSGDTVSSSDFSGKYQLIEFTYRSCYPCKKAIPTVNKIIQEFPEIAVFGLDPFDHEEIELLRDHIEKRDIKASMVLIQRQVVMDLSVPFFPTFYLVDPDGTLVWSHIGFQESDEEKMLKEIGEIVSP